MATVALFGSGNRTTTTGQTELIFLAHRIVFADMGKLGRAPVALQANRILWTNIIAGPVFVFAQLRPWFGATTIAQTDRVLWAHPAVAADLCPGCRATTPWMAPLVLVAH